MSVDYASVPVGHPGNSRLLLGYIPKHTGRRLQLMENLKLLSCK